MRHFLADDPGVNFLYGTERLLLRQCDAARDFEIASCVRYIPYPAVVFFWYDERMTGREWADIQEREKIIVLVDSM